MPFVDPVEYKTIETAVRTYTDRKYINIDHLSIYMMDHRDLYSIQPKCDLRHLRIAITTILSNNGWKQFAGGAKKGNSIFVIPWVTDDITDNAARKYFDGAYA